MQQSVYLVAKRAYLGPWRVYSLSMCPFSGDVLINGRGLVLTVGFTFPLQVGILLFVLPACDMMTKLCLHA